MTTASPKQQVKVIGSNGQISLGKQFAGRQVIVEEREPGVWLIQAATVVPDRELWIHQPEIQRSLQRALAAAASTAPAESDLDQFEKDLVNGPARENASDPAVKLDLNNPEFQRTLFALEKQAVPEVFGTLRKIASMTWLQVYRDNGLRWEKIESVRPPTGVEAVYSFRITRSIRALAFRQGEHMRLLLVSADHDATYGKK